MEGLFGNVYRGKTVLVTGDTGFKGTWLCLWLLQMGANVIGFALPPETNPSMFTALGMDAQIDHIDGDVRDFDGLQRVVAKYEPDIVLHLAAQALVRRSYRNPRDTFSTNVMGTVNLLEAVRRADRTRAVVNVTSDKVYSNREWVFAYRENDALGGLDPYSSSKACADLLTAVYQQPTFHHKEVGIATVRAGNVYGGGDWADERLVPDIVRSLVEGAPIHLRNPGSVRPWQYVLEPLSGYLSLAAEMYLSPAKFVGQWNFGPVASNALSVREFTSRVGNQWGGSYSIVESGPQTMPEANLLKLDWTKAASELRWRPVFTLDEGIREVVSWYQTYYLSSVDLERGLTYISNYVAAAERERLAWTP